MLRLLKKTCWLVLLAVGLQSASGFALLGLREPYQTGPLNYIGDFSMQPKNFDQGFRWTIPTVYYTYDATFLKYFGSNGVWSVDEGINILNALTNVSSYSSTLEEFPLESIRVNWTAQALGLFDLKSTALELMVEHLGLADPEIFTWTLRNRFLPNGATCPNFFYTVIQRNFDPITIAPSAYVNGNLYSYTIVEGCPVVDVGDAQEFTVDRAAVYSSPVASGKFIFANETYWGFYYTGLTRDDVGGLRWLYRTNNLIVSPTGSTTLSGGTTITYLTNTTTAQILFTSNLTTFASQALTNNAAALQVLYPDLVILSTTNIFTNVWTTNYIAYFTNYPMDPVGTFPHLVYSTTRDFSIQTQYYHVFGNLFTMTNTPGGYMAVPLATVPTQTGKRFVTLLTTTVTNRPTAPVGTVYTNTVPKTYLTNGIIGEYFILPTNSCTVAILGLQATFTNRSTNIIISATNTITAVDPNIPASTNQFFIEQSMVEYSTNHAFLVSAVVCETNSVALRQGIEKVTFVRRDYDSLLNRYFNPITNYYTLYAVTNNQIIPQRVQRVVTEPDFVFDAADLTGVGGPPLFHGTTSRQVPNFTVATNSVSGQGLLGPGTIEPVVTFTFNTVGPLYINLGPGDELDKQLTYIWGSYDGSTNAPVVYPIGTSVYDLENMALISITNPSLADGNVNTAYSEQLSVMGGTAPYAWSLRPQSAGLPAGLSLSPSGMIDGTPLQAGVYDIVVRLTDSGARFVDRALTLKINP
jgi:hypothetical protein